MKKCMFFLLILFFPIFVYADSGNSTIVMDVDSGRILYENNTNNVQLIASITKIMTCIVTLENASLDTLIVVGNEVLDIYGTNIYVQVGESMTIEDFLYGMMLRSGNDAAMVLATHVFDNYDVFISKMNEKAIELGMVNTFFSNPHGLDDDSHNYSTAYDMALLAKYAFQNSDYRKIISTKKYVTKSNLKSYVWYNRMSLLNQYTNCVGGKNGYTPKAGKTLVSYASNQSLTLLIVSLDDDNIYENHESLYNYFFNRYKKYCIVDPNHFSISHSLINRDVYIIDSISYPLLEDEVRSVSIIIHIYKQNDGSRIGKVVVKLDNKMIGEIPIYERIKKKKKSIGFFQKIRDLFV